MPVTVLFHLLALVIFHRMFWEALLTIVAKVNKGYRKSPQFMYQTGLSSSIERHTSNKAT
jgi:hypothetical protein